MYIRWKHQEMASGPSDIAHHAVLVKSERVGGKSRQRVIKHLATIRSFQLGEPDARATFWGKVLDRLAAVGIEAEDRRNRGISAVGDDRPGALPRLRQLRVIMLPGPFSLWSEGAANAARMATIRARLCRKCGGWR